MENVAVAGRSHPGLLIEEELAVIDRARKQYQALCPVPCTGCLYCMPCPNGVNIPKVFDVYTGAIMYEDQTRSKLVYRKGMEKKERADVCVGCGECRTKCPQGIDIPTWLVRAHGFLS